MMIALKQHIDRYKSKAFEIDIISSDREESISKLERSGGELQYNISGSGQHDPII